MLRTEAEASQMLCCGSEGCGTREIINAYRDPILLSQTRTCVGSSCMAWRWSHLEEVKEGGAHPHTWPDVAKFHPADTKRQFKRHGYCGLAGKVLRDPTILDDSLPF